MTVARYSEPYQATGSLAAEGVINQLGRPDIEPLEVLVREAVQNCWDARLEDRPSIRVEIGRHTMDDHTVRAITAHVLPDPPPGLPLEAALRAGARLLYFADFGTNGLGGPTRADEASSDLERDFVDFIRNIGQPPDRELGGGSFGYGKAAFYIASRARTIVVDSLCETANGLERRVIGAALGDNYSLDGRTYTGRHWWGKMIDGVPEPLTGAEADRAAATLGLPPRNGREGLGTTVAVIAPGVEPHGTEVMPFIVESLLWNFWPKMVATPGGVPRTIDFRVMDDGRRVPIPDPRTHDRLGPFVDAFDRLRTEADDADPTVLDQRIRSQRPIQDLGRVVIQRSPVPPLEIDDSPAMPRGRRLTLRGLHHVALMRTAELIVKYHRGPEPVTGRHGYAGVFRCSTVTDAAFRDAEPPTHDDWVPRSIPRGRERTYVSVVLQRIDAACREAAGLSGGARITSDADDVPLGEFADELARLMPGFEGPGARTAPRPSAGRRRRRRAPGASAAANQLSEDIWLDAVPTEAVEPSGSVDTTNGDGGQGRLHGSDVNVETTHAVPEPAGPMAARPKPQLRIAGPPTPALLDGHTPVMHYPFELRARGNAVSLTASVRVMTNDGESVERDPPRGWSPPEERIWIAGDGTRHEVATLQLDADTADGAWTVEIPITEDAILGVDIQTEVR